MNREIKIRKYEPADIPAMVRIWNEVVEEGVAFPQEDGLTEESGASFFVAQTYCGVAEDRSTKEVLGLYILHPNNIGRCGHLSNASYAVASSARGLHIGEKLVKDCIAQAILPVTRSSSLTPSSDPIFMPDICTSASASTCSELCRVVSA